MFLGKHFGSEIGWYLKERPHPLYSGSEIGWYLKERPQPLYKNLKGVELMLFCFF